MLSSARIGPRFVRPRTFQRYLPRQSPYTLRSSSGFPVLHRHYAFRPRPRPGPRPHRPSYSRFQQAGALWKTSPPPYLLVAILGGGIAVFVGVHIEKVPVSGRYRFNCVSEEQEAQYGRMGYQQVMQRYRGQLLKPSDPRHQMVGRVLKRLLPNAEGLKGDWEFHIIDDKEQMNAFVLPGGKVFVYSGIIPICQTEDGLAAVLGHEIAHNMAHHVQEKASLPFLITVVIGLVTFFFDNSAQLAQLVLSYGLELPNSRVQEARDARSDSKASIE
ncbi:MAG: hypothetical protein Q9212_004517 [Teloschistes hypoglaucus]